jgi:hypothetical protein
LVGKAGSAKLIDARLARPSAWDSAELHGGETPASGSVLLLSIF